MASALRLLLLLALWVVACGGEATRAPSAPRLAGPLAPLSFFVGTWDATATAADGSETSMVWRVKPALGGRWLSGRPDSFRAEWQAFVAGAWVTTRTETLTRRGG